MRWDSIKSRYLQYSNAAGKVLHLGAFLKRQFRLLLVAVNQTFVRMEQLLLANM